MSTKIAVIVSVRGSGRSQAVLARAAVEQVSLETLQAFSGDTLSQDAARALLPDFQESLESSTVYRVQLPKLSAPVGSATLQLMLDQDHPLLTSQELMVGLRGTWQSIGLEELNADPLMIELPLPDWSGTLDGELLLVGKLGTRGLLWKTWLTRTLVDKKQVPPLLEHTLRRVQVSAGKIRQSTLHPGSQDWDTLAQGRFLLFLHGTGMDGLASFRHMGAAALQRLMAPYSGMISLDHPTVLRSTLANAEWLIQHLPERALEMDILAVSRGGLVARQLVEQVDYGQVELRVHRAAFVATPHTGTPASFKDRGSITAKLRGLYTTGTSDLERSAPSTPGRPWARLLQDMPLRPGQADQNPGSEALRTLNTTFGPPALVQRHPGLRYHAITAEYQLPIARPGLKRPGLVRKARERAELVFSSPQAGSAEIINDLIVPCYSALGKDPRTRQPLADMDPNLAGLIPIPEGRYRRFGVDLDITHLSYLSRSEVHDTLREWLRG